MAKPTLKPKTTSTPKPILIKKIQKSSLDDVSQEIKVLTERIQQETPCRGFMPPLHQQVAFRTLAISENTLRGLDNAKKNFQTMTAIQHACIPHALAEKDILGAARTGRYVFTILVVVGVGVVVLNL